MRIISRFHDYYDGSSRWDESECVYNREFHETQFAPGDLPEPWAELVDHELSTLERLPLSGEAESLRSFFVMVAGEIYPAFQMVQWRRTLNGDRTTSLESFYDAQSTLAAIRAHPDPALRGGPMAIWSGRTLAQRLEDFFQAPAASRLRATLRSRRLPVAVLVPNAVRGARLLVDAALGHFGFFKVHRGDAVLERLENFLCKNR